jgi:hypothetical protein
VGGQLAIWATKFMLVTVGGLLFLYLNKILTIIVGADFAIFVVNNGRKCCSLNSRNQFWVLSDFAKYKYRFFEM